MTTAATHHRSLSRAQHSLLLLGAAAAQLLLAYAIASLALNSGSLWQYALALLLTAWGVHSVVQSIRNVVGGNKKQSTKA